jgi:hypothetical protein
MRRFVILGAAAALMLALLPVSQPAQAARATKTVEDAVVLSCEATTADGFVSMLAVVSSQFGRWGYLEFWATGTEPFADPPTIVSESARVTGNATAMSATFRLFEWDDTQDPPLGDSAGTSVLSATFTPDGDPVKVSDRFRDGNRWERLTGTLQALRAAGSLTLPGEDLDDLSGCFAEKQHLVYFSTNPSAYNDRFREFGLSCSWQSGAESVDLYVFADAYGAIADLSITSESSFIGGAADATLTTTGVAFEADLYDFEFDDPVGSAQASATLQATGVTERTFERSARDHYKAIAELYSVDGTLGVTIGAQTRTYAMDDEHCYAADQRIAFHSVRPSGPKGKPLANDAPDGAIRLRLGRTVKVVTGGNAIEPEAACTTVYPGESEPVEVPITYTAWYTVRGTGGELTATTARSAFDTVLGVYTLRGRSFRQIVCVDDVFEPDFSLQARATWSTTSGTTYYLQVGGFGGSAGVLRLKVE